MKTSFIGGFLAAGLVIAATAQRADAQSSAHDRHFVREFLQASLEIERIGQLAQTQSQDNHIKALGQKLVQDYTQAAQQVGAMALTASDRPQTSSGATREINKLENLSGPAFDKAALHKLFRRETAIAKELEAEAANSPFLGLRQVALLLNSALEPDLWQTAQLNGVLNPQI